MKKQLLLTLLAVSAMVTVMTANVSAESNQGLKPTARQAAPSICYVADHFYLTPAEALRRIGSWTDASSASNECPSAVAHKPFRVGFIPNSW